jgi:hypothetical protein
LDATRTVSVPLMRGSASLTYSERVVEVFLPKVEMTTQINLTGVLAGALPPSRSSFAPITRSSCCCGTTRPARSSFSAA